MIVQNSKKLRVYGVSLDDAQRVTQQLVAVLCRELTQIDRVLGTVERLIIVYVYGVVLKRRDVDGVRVHLLHLLYNPMSTARHQAHEGNHEYYQEGDDAESVAWVDIIIICLFHDEHFIVKKRQALPLLLLLLIYGSPRCCIISSTIFGVNLRVPVSHPNPRNAL